MQRCYLKVRAWDYKLKHSTALSHEHRYTLWYLEDFMATFILVSVDYLKNCMSGPVVKKQTVNLVFV